jgi:hypothetical protein
LEGIILVDDLVDFEKDTLEQIAANLRRPAGRVDDPKPNADEGATIPTPPFIFGAKSQKRLVIAAKLLRYYEVVCRPLTRANIQWTTVMKNFDAQWKALTDKKDADDPEVPKITKVCLLLCGRKYSETMYIKRLVYKLFLWPM